jgi:hypothetical protein
MIRKLSIHLFVLLAATRIFAFSGVGAGTEASPYRITNLAQLKEIVNESSAYYQLQNDIDVGGATINSLAPILVGTLDGQNHTISNFVINAPTEIYVGLFGQITGRLIRLHVVNGSVTGKGYVGGIAGKISKGVLDQVSFAGSVTSLANDYLGDRVGGFAGWATDSTLILNSSSNAVVHGARNFVGGFVGYVTGAVVISRCSSFGSAKADSSGAGGFAGRVEGSRIEHSLALASATGFNYVGGFSGLHYVGGAYYCIAAGAVSATGTGTLSVGGFLGEQETPGVASTGNLFDINTTGQKTTAGNVALPLTTAQLKQTSTYVNPMWEMGTRWAMDASVNDGYPNLLRQFSGEGTGSEADPFVIATLPQLQEMALEPYGNFVLAKDIDATDTKDWTSTFSPIYFNGNLNGQKHTISNLTVKQSGRINAGFFATVEGGIVKDLYFEKATISPFTNVGVVAGTAKSRMVNVQVTNSDVTGSDHVGGSFGKLISDVDIEGLSFSGTVTGYKYVGGLAGGISGQSIRRCSANATVVATGDTVGGLAGSGGSRDGGVTYGNFSKGSVQGRNMVGGLIGATGAWLDSNTSSATVEGSSQVGGLIGFLNQGEITRNWVNNTVTLTTQFGGGLVGYNQLSKIRHNVTNVQVTGLAAKDVGGLVGYSRYGSIDSNQVTGGYVKGYYNVGGFLGSSMNGMATIDNSTQAAVTAVRGNGGGFIGFMETSTTSLRDTARGAVDGKDSIGGFVGKNEGKIEQSIAEGSVTGTGEANGGFVGTNQLGVIRYGKATGDVKGSGTYVGGFVGRHGDNVHREGQITRSASFGAVEALSAHVIGLGGFAGYSADTITDSYTRSNVSGGYLQGGFAAYQNGYIANCYTAGTSTQATRQGGFDAYRVQEFFFSSIINSSFWDKTLSGQDTSISSSTAIGLTTTQMKDKSTYTTALWDFTNVWDIDPTINDGYPFLRSAQDNGGTVNTQMMVKSSLPAQLFITQQEGVLYANGVLSLYNMAGRSLTQSALGQIRLVNIPEGSYIAVVRSHGTQFARNIKVGKN